jgi:hypothetical protein
MTVPTVPKWVWDGREDRKTIFRKGRLKENATPHSKHK